MKAKTRKNIVVIYWGDDWDSKLPMVNEITRQAFKKWHTMGLKRNIATYRASIDWYDEQKNVFTKAWTFRDGRWIKIKKNIKADLIYDKIAGKYDLAILDKKLYMSKHVKMFNNPLMRMMINNKLFQYALFEEFMPKSFLAMNKKELGIAMAKIKSKKIVIKPLYGSGGNGIIINEKKEAFEKKYKYPVLVQEFISSEKGIPGFSKKKEISDLRLVYMNHELSYALSRIAKKGSLFTNLHQGASGIVITRKHIPQKVSAMAAAIIKKMKIFSDAEYSLDFIFSNSGKIFLVELNTVPGIEIITALGDKKLPKKNYNNFVKLME